MALVSSSGGDVPRTYSTPSIGPLRAPKRTTSRIAALDKAYPRPSTLAEPMRRVIRDELRRQRLTRSYFVGVGLTDADRRDEPAHIVLYRDAQGRVVLAEAGPTRYSLERTPNGLLYRVTEERSAEGREVVWVFQRGPDMRIVRVVPTVRERPAEEVEVGP